MKFSPLLSDLIKSLQILPGVGPKTAKRMAMSLLAGNHAEAKKLAINLSKAIYLIVVCPVYYKHIKLPTIITVESAYVAQ